MEHLNDRPVVDAFPLWGGRGGIFLFRFFFVLFTNGFTVWFILWFTVWFILWFTVWFIFGLILNHTINQPVYGRSVCPP